jgi:Spy/CpxP family protein refolding chaperone
MVKQQKVVLLVAGLVGVLVAAVLLVGAVADVAAQGQGGGGRPGFGRGGNFGPGGSGVFGPGGLGLDGANLTEAQRQQVRAIIEQHRDEIRGMNDRVAQARRALIASAENGQPDEAQANELGQATATLALAEARIRAEVMQLLTPEQRAEVQRRAAERAQRAAEHAGRRGQQ